jgi:hypothetical protein
MNNYRITIQRDSAPFVDYLDNILYYCTNIDSIKNRRIEEHRIRKDSLIFPELDLLILNISEEQKEQLKNHTNYITSITLTKNQKQ